MLYITDKGHMNEIPEDVSEGDRVVVFCKETDSIRVLDMGRLLAAARLVPVEFVPADTKDEMLLAIGGMLEHEEMCTVLFPAGTIPKRYADKIKTVRRAAKKKPAKKAERKSRGKETPAAGKVKNEEAADKEAGGADAAKAPLPETETAADGKADAPAGKPVDDPFRTGTAHAEQEEARKKAGCGENDWWVPQESFAREAESPSADKKAPERAPETDDAVWPESKYDKAREKEEEARRKASSDLLARADAAMAGAETRREEKA